MIMFGSFLPSLLVGFSTTNFTREREQTLSWSQLHSSSILVGLAASDNNHDLMLGADCGQYRDSSRSWEV